MISLSVLNYLDQLYITSTKPPVKTKVLKISPSFGLPLTLPTANIKYSLHSMALRCWRGGERMAKLAGMREGRIWVRGNYVLVVKPQCVIGDSPSSSHTLRLFNG